MCAFSQHVLMPDHKLMRAVNDQILGVLVIHTTMPPDENIRTLHWQTVWQKLPDMPFTTESATCQVVEGNLLVIAEF